MLNELAKQKGIALHCQQKGSVFTPFFTKNAPQNLDDVMAIDTKKYARFFAEMLKRDIYLPPSQFELAFINTAHTDEHIKKYLSAASESLDIVASIS